MRYFALIMLCAAAGCSDAEPVGPGDGGPLVDAAPLMDAGDPCSEENMQSDPDNCGSCGNRCVLFGADALCAEGECGLDACLEGYVDLNNDASDGCEYQCSITDPLDPIDSEGRDENCDGFDGLLSQLIFVSPGGDDGEQGLQDAPVASFAAALSLADPNGSRRAIVIAEGTYDLSGIGEVPAGISLHGGFRDDGRWTRDVEARATFGETVGPLVIGGGAGVTIEGLELSTESRTVERDGQSASALGLVILDGEGLRGHNLIVRAGAGTDGVDGRPGLDGATGLNGGGGQRGCEDSSGFCSDCDRPNAGTGGSSPCGAAGGAGGRPGHGGGAGRDGAPGLGEPVEGAPEGANGAGGSPGGAGSGFNSGGQGGVGSTGVAGAAGDAGQQAGRFDALVYQIASGSIGVIGGAGGGGAGGGGGGGGGRGLRCDNFGGAAGGGGGGGCGGTGGGPGTGGGASVALLVIAGSPQLTQSTFTTLGGGHGGAGALGGVGGVGGDGGNGGARYSDSGAGGTGGNGGDGGLGGSGGGGGGGPSVGVWLADGSQGQVTTCIFELGPGGEGGLGATRGEEEEPTNSGATGLSVSVYAATP